MKKILIFVPIFTSDADVKAEADGGDTYIEKGVYYGALFFDSLIVSQTIKSVRNKATVDHYNNDKESESKTKKALSV